jgi:hypothetical protein
MPPATAAVCSLGGGVMRRMGKWVLFIHVLLLHMYFQYNVPCVYLGGGRGVWWGGADDLGVLTYFALSALVFGGEEFLASFLLLLLLLLLLREEEEHHDNSSNNNK